MAFDKAPAVLDRSGLDTLVKVLAARGRRVVGPTVRDGAIVLDELTSAEELPYGWEADVEAGHYRLRRRDDAPAFAHTAGPHAWKRYLHPPRELQWTAARGEDGELTVVPGATEQPSYAFLGVRPCDLRAIAIQDKVLAGGKFPDTGYATRREQAFLIVVECTEPGAACFCASAGSGPGAESGFDLALTEVVDDAGHRFLARAGSAEGAEVLAELPVRPADEATTGTARRLVDEAASRMGRTLPDVDLRGLLQASLEAAHWDDVAERCLTCGNCTLVCPTCFCTTTEDVNDLAGDHAERWTRWDSCFDLDFTQMHGGAVRSSGKSRYRQWLTHKLGTWHDQFGSSGCVGCGRCIVWCPVGIDITQETEALRREAEAPVEASR